jgi:hypothetical protein
VREGVRFSDTGAVRPVRNRRGHGLRLAEKRPLREAPMVFGLNPVRPE